jgi:drug/metabolite transporter (DMT)-like permease
MLPATMSRRSWVLMGVLASTWGASYMFIKVGLRDFSAPMVVCLRTALAAAVLAPVALHRGAFRGLRAKTGWLLVLAVVQVAVPFMLITVGEHHIDSAMAGILVASAPIFTALVAQRIDVDERSRGWGLVGVAVGMVGVALLFGIDLSGDADTLLGGLLVLLASVGYAIGPFVLKRRLAGAEPSGVAATSMALAALLTLPAAVADPPSSAGTEPVLAILALGALGTGLAFLVFYTLIAEVGPARASLVAYIAPGFAVVYGVALLGESITAGTAAGLALILAGSYLGAEGRLPWRPKAPVPAVAGVS